MGLLSHAIQKHSCGSQHISVLTTCTLMFGQVFTIELLFFNTTSGMHRRPFVGGRLVLVQVCKSIYKHIYFLFQTVVDRERGIAARRFYKRAKTLLE